MRYEVVGGDMLPPIRVALTHSKRRAAAEVSRCAERRRERDLLDLLDRADATTSALTDPETGERLHLVTMTPNTGYPAEEDAAILAHEAVHVALGYLEDIGEDEPGEEMTAYAVQAVARSLVGRHFEWKRKMLEKEGCE